MRNSYPKPIPQGSRPSPTGIPNPSCPTLAEARNVLDRTNDLQRAIRRLKWSTQRCQTCPERAVCPTTSYFLQAVDTAIRELRAEWGLDHE